MMDEVPDYDDWDRLPLSETPYRPHLVEIGPEYTELEKCYYEGKKRYASSLVRLTNQEFDGYLPEMRRLVDIMCKKCYKDQRGYKLSYDEWMQDSCFIVELFRKYMMKELRDADDPIFNTGQTLHLLRRDLISIGNQLPFSVLVRFFNMTKIEDERDNLIDLALYFFQNMVGHTLKAPDQITVHGVKHLLGLVHDSLCLATFENTVGPPDQVTIHGVKHLLGLVHDSLCLPTHGFDKEVNSTTMEIETECEFINCATELQEAGIKFEKFEGKSLLDIKFKNGVMRIPALKVADNTMYLLQNLIEYEKRFPISRPRYVTDYAKFMRCLINTPMDVTVLRRSGIIRNWIGYDDMIFTTLIKLGSETELSSKFTYSKVLEGVNEHCKHRRHRWMANLWRNYFNSPWAFVSFVAAVVLLLLTLTQTVFTILSYHP